MRHVAVAFALVLWALSPSNADASCDAGYDPTQCYDWWAAQRNEIRCAAEGFAACALDSECVVLSPTTACVGVGPVAINKGKQAEFDSEKSRIADEYCSMDLACCGVQAPSSDGGYPACWDGSCVYVDVPPDIGFNPQSHCGIDAGWTPDDAGQGDAGGTWDVATAADAHTPATQDCATIMDSIDGEVEGLAASLGECTVDDDCMAVSDSLGCRGGCGVAVNVGLVGELKEGLVAIERKWCISDNTCGSTPGCASSRPVCRGGACMLEPESATGCSCSTMEL